MKMSTVLARSHSPGPIHVTPPRTPVGRLDGNLGGGRRFCFKKWQLNYTTKR